MRIKIKFIQSRTGFWKCVRIQTLAPALDKNTGPMGGRFYPVLGRGLAPSQGERNRFLLSTSQSSQHQHWVKMGGVRPGRSQHERHFLVLGGKKSREGGRRPIKGRQVGTSGQNPNTGKPAKFKKVYMGALKWGL